MNPFIGIGPTITRRRGGGGPKNLTLTLIVGGVRISWDDMIGESGYEIWVSVNGSVATLLGSVLADVTSYDDTTVYDIGDTVTYLVRAARGYTYSDFSEASTQITEPEIPSLLEDGNTIIFADADDEDTFTLSGSNVASWGDKLGGPVAFTEATNRPVRNASGYVTFQNKALSTGSITYGQPYMFYMVIRPRTVTANDPIVIGPNNNDGVNMMQGNNYEGIRVGPATFQNVAITTNTWHILSMSVVGQWNKQRVALDGTQVVYRDIWAPTNANGVKLGDTRVNQKCNFDLAAIIARKVVDNSTNEAIIRNYLTEKYPDFL